MATTRKTPAKAVAAKAKAETEAEPTVEEKRERREELVEELNAASLEEQKEEIAEQKAAGQGPKIDDDGAIEQQRAAREGHVKERQELGELSGPPVVAPVIEKGIKIDLESRRDLDKKVEKHVDTDRFVGNMLFVTGKGVPSVPGEVILDVRRKNGSDHARFSTWVEDEKFEINLPGLTGPGDWLIHCEQLVTAVGEGRADGLPRILESNELSLELR